MISKTLPLACFAVAALIGPALMTPVLVTPASAQEPSYTIDDVTACSQDAMRLCRDKLPDLDAIEGCMKANYERLHPACRSRFDRQR
jgi:hypothetical protein